MGLRGVSLRATQTRSGTRKWGMTNTPPHRTASAVEAAVYAQRSRRWIFDRLRDNSLTRYRSPRDARITFVDLDELDELINDIHPAA